MKFLFISFLISLSLMGTPPIKLLSEQQVGIDTSCAINNYGDWIASSTLGAYLNGEKILDEGKVGRGSLAKINDRGDWLVVSQLGIFYNGTKLLQNFTLGTEFDAGMSFHGHWIVAGKAFGVILDGFPVLGKEKVGISVAVEIVNGGDWIVSSTKGVYMGKAD